MGRPVKKFIRYVLLNSLKKTQLSNQDNRRSQSEFLLENRFDGSEADLKHQTEEAEEETTNFLENEDQPEEATNNHISQSNKQNAKGTSYLESLMLFLKANIGSGVLAMPYGFTNSGLIFGSVSLWIMGVICTMCIHVLINC